MADNYTYATFGGKRKRRKVDASGNALADSKWEDDDSGSDKTTKEIGETIGGYQKHEKPTKVYPGKDPNSAEANKARGGPASLGESAAYTRAKREWEKENNK